MRHTAYVPAGAFAPVLSLGALYDRRDADDANSFDIPDRDALPLLDQMVQAESRAAVASFIRSLSARDRLIVRRLFWDDQTQTEIARELGISKMAVSKALARIRKFGRHVLAPHEHLAHMN